MGRLVPRTLASRAVALLLAIVAVIVLAGSALAVLDARADGRRSAEARVTAVATSLADVPSTAEALGTADPSARLQPLTELVRGANNIDFITIMRVDGTRVTHTDPARIGERYLGSTTEALHGETYVETYEGTLGPSVRTIAPVRDARGEIVGMVSAGVTVSALTRDWLGQLAAILGIAALALLVAGIGLALIRREILRSTGGLAPADLRLMYEHHDAVLHAIGEGVVVLEAGRAVLVNDEALRLLSAEDGSFRDEDVADLVPPAGERGEVLVAHRGRVLLVHRTEVGRDSGGRRGGSSVVTLRDQTELSEAIGELDTMTRFAEALRSQAHESANRLHTVVALYEMGRGAEAAEIATTELALSQELIDRMGAAIAEPALVALLLGKSAQASERGIELTVTEESQLGDEATQVLSTREMITVIGNLLDNALDACDPADAWVEVTVAGDADGVGIVVADSGEGMDPELFARAQRRGFSTKAGGDAAGRGLGLALVAHVVRSHGGTLAAERTYGSVVSAWIPAGPRGAAGPAEPAGQSRSADPDDASHEREEGERS